jgi:hypothetical protein
MLMPSLPKAGYELARHYTQWGSQGKLLQRRAAAPAARLDKAEKWPERPAGGRLMAFRPTPLLVLLPLLWGCADSGGYAMWNSDTLQQVDCRKSEAFGASDAPDGYRRSLPYSCIAACEWAGFAGRDRALERALAVTDLRSLDRLSDSEVPPLCRLSE